MSDLLQHLYVLIPTLDGDKHYWVDRTEVDKLLNRGGDWLSRHPERDLIVDRYLRGLRSLTSEALERLLAEEPPPREPESAESAEETIEKPLRLADQRMDVVAKTLKEAGAKRVLDLGCGEGRLVRRLLADPFFDEVVGVDTSMALLARAKERLSLDRLPESQRSKVRLLHSSLTYRDRRLAGAPAWRVLRQSVLHPDPPDVYPAHRRSPVEADADE